jgi:hypothetical protein
MDTQRKILIGGVGLVRGKVRDAGINMVKVCDTLEPIINEKNLFLKMPFKYISLIIRYGETTNLNPEIQPILKRYGELPVSIEVNIKLLQDFSKKGEIYDLILFLTLSTLIKVGLSFGFDIVVLTSEINKLSKFNNTFEVSALK